MIFKNSVGNRSPALTSKSKVGERLIFWGEFEYGQPGLSARYRDISAARHGKAFAKQADRYPTEGQWRVSEIL